jgi:UDP-glucose 4-epimerase
MKYLVTGGAGYIGSHIVDELLKRNQKVIAYDNMSAGQFEFISNAIKNDNFQFIHGDILDFEKLKLAMNGVDCVYHMAANADIRAGFKDPSLDLNQNIVGTFNVLEAMRQNSARKIIFASSSAVLGEPEIFPTPESCSIPIQTSLYGAAKLAGEGLISAYCEGYQFEGYAFRFATVLGPRYPHGFIFDFVKKLKTNPNILEVLGDGTGKKTSLYIFDVINALMHIAEDLQTAKQSKHHFQEYHIANDVYYTVKESAEWVCEAMQLTPKIQYGNTPKGWPGDVPLIILDTTKANKTGWKVTKNPKDCIFETVQWLKNNLWIYERRK